MAFDRQIAAITCYCEASSETHEARVAVIASMFNRLKSGKYESTIAANCLKRKWFSEWNADVINNANLLRAAHVPDIDPMMVDCLKAYDEAAAGADPSLGATHYHDESVVPEWTLGATKTRQIGKLVFWKNVP